MSVNGRAMRSPRFWPARAAGIAMLLVGAAGAKAQNIIQNPNFDAGFASWTPTSSTDYSVTWDGAEGFPAPGSARIDLTTSPGATEVFALLQCVPVLSSEAYDVGGSFRSASGFGTTPASSVIVQPYTGANCTGSSLGANGFGISTSATPTDTWVSQNYVSGLTTPPTAVSARVILRLSTFAAGTARGWFDAIQLSRTSPVELQGFAIE